MRRRSYIYVHGACGWMQFMSGFCDAGIVANMQLFMFKTWYPDRLFRLIEREECYDIQD